MTAPGARSPLPPWLSPLGTIAEPVYRAVITRRNRRFDARRGVVEFDRPVISVGNLSVGGTGKTPATLLLVRMLRERGHWPCVAMRGYAQHAGVSDEAAEYRAAFPDLPMVVQPNRTQGLLELFASEAGSRVDCVLLDDGFQHRRIARQLDIVLVDATRSPFHDHLLPRGWLREPVQSLRRAHAVIVTHTESVDAAAAESLRADIAGQCSPGTPVLAASHAWASLTVSQGGAASAQPLSWLRHRRAVACCAIGNPGPFLAQVRHQTQVVGEVVLRDHDRYAPATLRRIHAAMNEHNADTLLVTSKDWAKLSRKPWPCPVAVPALTLAVDTGPIHALLDAVFRHEAPPAHEPDA
ncbi:MAG TPA: tetraacyldisaccharide 4'-kinase [Phycisphaerales bacterium]|nr:tetraacyldisaccharide 4'-kinase [Phycisphaerales bacterium]